jgi:hypothetical protein
VVFKHTLCVLQAQGQVQLEDRCSGIASKFTGQTEKLYANGADTPQFVSTVSAKLRQDPSIDSVVTLGPALGVAVRPGRVVDIGPVATRSPPFNEQANRCRAGLGD